MGLIFSGSRDWDEDDLMCGGGWSEDDTVFPTPRDRNTSPNPNPYAFKILRQKQISDFTALVVYYPHCPSYYGRKILVFKGTTYDIDFKDAEVLDPHFFMKSKLVARFEATEEGWDMAIAFAEAVTAKNRFD